MKLFFGLAYLMVIFCGTPAHARSIDGACTKRLHDVVGLYLKIENFSPTSEGGAIVSEACRSWPDKGGFLLTAFAFDKGIENEKSLFVALIDRATMRIIATHQGVIDEDAITEVGVSSLQLDTAPYRLSATVRAFGLRFTSSARGPSCADHASWDKLNLFVREGSNLRPIFSKDMQYQNRLRGCIGTATGHDVWEYEKLTISIASTASKGYSDLHIVDIVDVDGNMKTIPDGINTHRRVKGYTVKYDGKEYLDSACTGVDGHNPCPGVP